LSELLWELVSRVRAHHEREDAQTFSPFHDLNFESRKRFAEDFLRGPRSTVEGTTLRGNASGGASPR